MANPILVANDSIYDLELTLLALEKCGVLNPVVTVRDGEEALDYLLSRRFYKERAFGNPTLILLDLKMPKVDGLEVLKTLRSTPILSSIPVIVLTHSALSTDMQSAQNLGIDRYIVKPIELHQFMDDVCRAVSAYVS